MEIIDPEQKKTFEERRLNQEPLQNDSTGRIMAGLIVILIGGLLLARKMGVYFPEWLFSWQMLIIGNRNSRRGWASGKISESNEELMESVAVFGGIKKNVISKNFKGGEAVSIFGGTEINLSQADINGNVELELVQIFGGTKIILPPHWQVKSEMVSIFGGIEDTRIVQKEVVDFNKTLILKGVSLFGSIHIKSF
ncbi:MAG: hypothetical protein IPP71_18090 [Bacteroidetes bacterium]|nr:hypothetical protein [Bacteroidota bacterium]